MRHPANAAASFPRKLWEILEEEDQNIVGWSDSGNAFFIRSMDLFIDEILTKYFRHNKFSSFQRQLNLYGFKKVNKGPDSGAYAMKLFQRAHPDNLAKIKRSPQPSSSGSRRRSGASARHSSVGSTSDEDSDDEYRPRGSSTRSFVGDCFTSRGRRVRAARSLAEEQAAEARQSQRALYEKQQQQEQREQREQTQAEAQRAQAQVVYDSQYRAAAMARMRAPAAAARTPTQTMNAYQQYDAQFLQKAGVAPGVVQSQCSLSSEYLDRKLVELNSEHPYSQNLAMQPPRNQAPQAQAVPTRVARSASNQSIEPQAIDEFSGEFASRSSIGSSASSGGISMEELPVAVAAPAQTASGPSSVPLAAASFSYSRSSSMDQVGFLQDLGGDLDAFWDKPSQQGHQAQKAAAPMPAPMPMPPAPAAPAPAPTQFVSFNPMSMGMPTTSISMPSRG